MKTFRIKRQFALKWQEYLRSNAFKQGFGGLHSPIEDNYCCLGVACVLAKDLGLPVEISVDADSGAGTFNGQGDVLPKDIIEFAGITDMLGNLTANPKMGSHKASEWNDDEAASFMQIADLIEEYGEYYD